MEIDIPPESPNLDAQHTELQSRYETLQQEHNSILAQQEILVSKCGAQHERINHLMSIQPCRDAQCNGTHSLPGLRVARSAFVYKQALCASILQLLFS
jgi:hypothetical protein